MDCGCSSGLLGVPCTEQLLERSGQYTHAGDRLSFSDSITAGSAAFTLFISGTGFESNTTGFLDGTSRPSKFNTVTGQVEMSLTAEDVAVPDASVQVSVANPLPGGTSNTLTFVVNPIANGAPTITASLPQRLRWHDGTFCSQRRRYGFRANVRGELEWKPSR